ncbi:MAG: hypothetical protein ACTHXC_10975 [Brachybacterium sp.]
MDLNPLIREVRGSYIAAVLLDRAGHRPLADGELSPAAVHSAKRWLDDNKLILGESLAGDFDLTYDAEQLADALQKDRTSGEGRWDAVTRAVAEAIEAGQRYPEVDTVDGAEVTDRELQVGLERLARWELIDVVGDGGRILRADARPALVEVSGVRGLLKDHYEGGQGPGHRVSNTTNISGGTVGGVQTGGSANAMHVTQTITPVEQADILAKVTNVIDTLAGVEGVEELRAAIDDIRDTAAEPAPSKPALKDKVIEALAIAGATRGVEQVIAPLAQLLPWVSG